MMFPQNVIYFFLNTIIKYLWFVPAVKTLTM